VVQPWNKDGFKYRLIVGFRRMRAVTFFLKWTEILAHIADVTEHEARMLNLVENLERKNLNLLEEANGLRNLYPEGVTVQRAKAELKRSTTWIRARIALLRMSPTIQQQAAAGLLTASDILALIPLVPDEQLTSMRRIIERRALPYYRNPMRKMPKHPCPTVKRIRQLVRQLLTWGIDGLPTRALAWAAGDIDIVDFMNDVKVVVQKIRETDDDDT